MTSFDGRRGRVHVHRWSLKLDHLPVLVLHGGADDLAPVALAERLPDARLVVFDEDRHNVLHELDRDQVHAELLRFVAAVTTP